MALAPLATPVSGDSIAAALWNAEFLNIYHNGLSLISPLTGNLDVNSNQLTNVRVENVTSATPSAGSAGRLVYVTTGKQLQLDDGAQIRFPVALYGLAAGDLIIATSSGQYGRLAVGTFGQVLQATGGLPAWTSYLTVGGINATGSLVVGGGQSVTKILSATGACVWPALNSGATISTTLAVTGASVTNTDTVQVAHTAVTMASVLMHGYVSSSGTVTVTLYNGTGATLNVGSGTLRATVFQYV
jgi:hypothetical protein